MIGEEHRILVTGAAGQVGAVGRTVTELLLKAGQPVRALVRQDDDRAAYLRNLGAEVVVADLTKTEEVVSALEGCRLVFFSMSASSQFLEATAVMAAAARAKGDIELLVNLSQMTVSELTLTNVTKSPQHRVQWLGEQILNWSGVPVTHLRPTAFQENPLFWGAAAASIQKLGSIRLPFRQSLISPVAANDVAEVAAKVLLQPGQYAGRALELTGPRAATMEDLAKEYSAALGRPVKYEDIPLGIWAEELLSKAGLDPHTYHHILTMAELHGAGRYNRSTQTIQEILGRPAASISETITSRRDSFPLPQTA
ncbi:NAD(P)-binding protein [Thozetella sp. PMI_491]|nr:NAD(P)-binding protein [Thozetella sp. PMI_491]